MGYKLTNYNYNGLVLTNCYAKIVEARQIFEEENVVISFCIGIYPNKEVSESNSCLGCIYENSFIMSKDDFNIDVKLNIYSWLNELIYTEDTRESIIFSGAERF